MFLPLRRARWIAPGEDRCRGCAKAGARPGAAERHRERCSSEEWWAELDSNQRRRKPADLQSAPFGHFGIYPVKEESGIVGVLPVPGQAFCMGEFCCGMETKEEAPGRLLNGGREGCVTPDPTTTEGWARGMGQKQWRPAPQKAEAV